MSSSNQIDEFFTLLNGFRETINPTNTNILPINNLTQDNTVIFNNNLESTQITVLPNLWLLSTYGPMIEANNVPRSSHINSNNNPLYSNNNSTLKSLNEDGNQIGKSTDIIGSTFVNAKIRYNLQLTDIFQIIPTFGYKYNQINPFEFKNSASRSNTVKAMSTHSLFLGASAISNYLLDDAELINEIHILGDFTVIKPENTNISSACIANIHLSLNETLTDWNVGNSLNIGASSKIICNNFVSGIGLDWKTSSNYTGFSGNISMRLEV